MISGDNAKYLKLSFKEAQVLYSLYSTFQSKDKLRNSLLDTLDHLAFGSLNLEEDSRELINKIILTHYPNEMSVKANFIKKILFKSNNHVTIFELPIGNSRIDLCKLNGSSVAYEIKTDLDNLSRLGKQLNDYIEIFENVFVICSSKRLDEVEKRILPECGIYTYSISKYGNYIFKLQKKAIKSQQLNPEKQLHLLWKTELIKFFSINSLASKDDLISLILQKFSSQQINNIFKQALKKRYQNQWEFLKNHRSQILEIDYQWFFKNNISPSIIYG